MCGLDAALQPGSWFLPARGEPDSLGLRAKQLISLPLSPFSLEPQSRAGGGGEAVDQLIVLNLSTQILLSPSHG